MSKVNVYCAGGTGINIGQRLASLGNNKLDGFAEFETFLIDTSDANKMKPVAVDDEHFYKVESKEIKDGAGKKRDTHYMSIAERSKEILLRFKPADFNIVIHSVSGGSGSVIGPVLVGELLSRNAPVVVILVESTASLIEINNAIKTLQSYENIATSKGHPVPAVYYRNTKEFNRGEVDQRINTTVALLLTIFSGQNHELDRQDIVNFMDYTRLTNYPAALTCMDFYIEETEQKRGQSIISLLTLADEDSSTIPPVPVGYQAVGFISAAAREKITVDLPLHVGMVSGYFHEIMDSLKQSARVVEEVQSTTVVKSINDSAIKAESTGIVL